MDSCSHLWLLFPSDCPHLISCFILLILLPIFLTLSSSLHPLCHCSNPIQCHLSPELLKMCSASRLTPYQPYSAMQPRNLSKCKSNTFLQYCFITLMLNLKLPSITSKFFTPDCLCLNPFCRIFHMLCILYSSHAVHHIYYALSH